MFEENIVPLWEEWKEVYEKEKIEEKERFKDGPILDPNADTDYGALGGLAIAFSIIISIGIYIWLGNDLWLISLIVGIILARLIWKYDERTPNLNPPRQLPLDAYHSAQRFCAERVYDVEKKDFPFPIHYNESSCGGKRFRYETADVILHDTSYIGEGNDIGVVVEIIPNAEVGEGTIVWGINGKFKITEDLNLDEKIVECIKELMIMENNSLVHKCQREDKSFYLSMHSVAMGLLVDWTGDLYNKKRKTFWKNADKVVRILDSCLGERL